MAAPRRPSTQTQVDELCPVSFQAALWLYTGAGAWHFITLSPTVANKLRKQHEGPRRGWGSIPVVVTVGATSWKTSVFPHKESGGVLLPVKASVRKAEGLRLGENVRGHIVVLRDTRGHV